MRKGSLNVIELHVEKGVAALAALFALYAVATYLVGSPHQVEYQRQPVSPPELDERILASAQQLADRLERAVPESTPVPDFAGQVAAALRSSILTPPNEQAAAVPPVLPRAAPFGEPIRIPGEKADARRNVRLVQPLAPSQPVCARGRSIVIEEQLDLMPIEERAAAMTLGEQAPPTRALSWVSIAAYWDYEAQLQAHQQAGYVSYRLAPYLAKVRAQRQQRAPDGSWPETWTDVDPNRAMPRLVVPQPQYDPASGLTNRPEIAAAFQIVKSNRLVLAQPPFFQIARGDPWFIPPLPGHTPADWREAAKAQEEQPEGGFDQASRDRDDAASMEAFLNRGGGGGRGGPPGRMGGGRSQDRTRDDDRVSRADLRKRAEVDFLVARQAFVAQDYARAREACEAVIENDAARTPTERDAEALIKKLDAIDLALQFGLPRWVDARSDSPRIVRDPQSEGNVAVWFHDDTAVPGRTYRYRLRVDLWNRYFDEPAELENPEEAERVLLRGAWSEPSDSVVVVPESYFVPEAALPDGQSVRCEVWTWRDGWWISERFDIAPGEPIGGPTEVEIAEIAEDEDGDEALRETRRTVDFSTGATFVRLREADAGDAARVGRPEIMVVYRLPGEDFDRETPIESRGRSDPNFDGFP